MPSEVPLFATQNAHEPLQWFVMRDLKRSNAKLPAYKQLEEAHFEVFTPMKWQLTVKDGKRARREVPFIQDLLFVHSSYEPLAGVVQDTPTLQFRYSKGGAYCDPMVVRDDAMERFIRAVRSTDAPKYYLPSELTPAMCGRKVHIVGGALDGYEGNLLALRGSKRKYLLIELPGFFSAGIEVEPDYIQFL